ncbi:MAG TPA: type II toxin-antitoxin system death-on-curing family toxin [Acidobacteriaceae bacterium]|nr:type II toxin-antitoxin system death-on-curing family toxin [Acidobacteriaceae bacterium]
MNPREIRWVSEEVVLAVHNEQIEEHGGARGLRDASLLSSAITRPRNVAAYGSDPDLADLAAAYAIGIARNHPFVDGNKRTAIVVAAGVFLPVNGYELNAANKDLVRTMLLVADGSMQEQELAAWFRQWMRPLPQQEDEP